jgi:hypothetical protein
MSIYVDPVLVGAQPAPWGYLAMCTGPTGPPGSAANFGATGPTGAPSAIPGPVGATGPTGAPSAVAGPTGSTGPTGPAGSSGLSIVGPPGSTGATGATGACPEGWILKKIDSQRQNQYFDDDRKKSIASLLKSISRFILKIDILRLDIDFFFQKSISNKNIDFNIIIQNHLNIHVYVYAFLYIQIHLYIYIRVYNIVHIYETV